ncbi:MAG: YihY/virulence factor BrkB family protein, partial [Kiritimatiellia bacterium]
MRNWGNKKKPLALFGLILVESGKSFLANQGFQSAATLAYYGFFALIPMLLLVVIVLGYLSGSSEVVLTNITGVVERLVPEFSDVILNEIHLLARQKAWGAFSIIVLLWVVTPFTNAVRAAFSRIFRANRRANVIMSRGLSVATGIALVCFLVVLVLGQTLVGTVLGHVSLQATWPLGIFIAKTLVSLIASSLFVALFYLLFTPVKIKAAELLTGAGVTGALLWAIRPAFSFLIRFRPNYGLTFGSLKAVFVVTVWV